MFEDVDMKKYLFIDRDGTLVCEPEDYQVDALSKIKFLPRVVPALLKLQDMGFSFVMVSNQDGLGTESFPLETFTPAHEFILHTLESQGITFEQVLICPHKPEDNCECRKPKLGMMTAYMRSDAWSREHSYFIGDRDTDMTMGINMGITPVRVGLCEDSAIAPEDAASCSCCANDAGACDAGSASTGAASACASDAEACVASGTLKPANIKAKTWDEIVDFIAQREAALDAKHCNDGSCGRKGRVAVVTRETKETSIFVKVDLDHSGSRQIDTGIGFFDHMLDQIAVHAGFNCNIKVKGDLYIDDHHTTEDTGIALGTALKRALGDKRGIGRFGFIVPMDELQAKVYGCDVNDRVTLDAKCAVTTEPCSCADDSTVAVALDISGRPHADFSLDASFTRDKIHDFETQMVAHFFESLAFAMGITLHMSVTQGNAHHQVEALFKAFGRALRPAIAVVTNELPSSKGTL